MNWRIYPLLLGVLTACEAGGVQETLGINREAPDEFVVVSRPPLSVPPEFDLKPPTPGAISPHESTRHRAKGAVLRNKKPDTAVEGVSVSDASSSADAVFFGKLRVDDANPEIRQILGVDITKKPDTSGAKTLLEKLNASPTEQPVVDAKKETERLRKNKKEGKSVTEGETPTMEKQNKGILDAIF